MSVLKTLGLQGEHTALCQAHVSYAGDSLQAATSTKEGKALRRGKISKKVLSRS